MENKMNIDSYLKMAEKNFSNMSADMVTQGQNNYGFYGGGNQGQYLVDPMWANMNGQIMAQRGGNFGVSRNVVYGADGGQGAVVPAKQPTPYQVNVTNTTPNPLTVVLFGLNTYLLTPNFGTSVGVTVTPAQSNVSYLELLQQSASNPFSTSLIRIQTSNPSQITQILTLTSKDANGQLCQIPIITQSYFSANQFQSTILDVPYPVKIDGNTYLTFPILGNTTATYTFFPAEKINPARNLGGGDQQQLYSAPAVPVAVPMFAPASQVGMGGQLMIDPANH
jgi:hypothetical protein